MKKDYILLILFTMIVSVLSAQNYQITGKVLSSVDNISIPGVSIIVKGTMRGTTSDIDGTYSISAPADGILVFTFVGMKKLEVPINGKKVIDVNMIEDKIDLGEVVVVGFSSDSKKLISSSFGLVSESEIKDVPLRTIDGVLQGKTAGIVINQNSGTPGGQSTIKLRGGSSINAGNAPLIVIDGIPSISGSFGQIGYSGQEISALADLNPNDIESVTILKDASSTAIYGARGSNGVILVTTKKGSSQKTSINLNVSYGMQKLPGERMLDLMNAQQWNEYRGTNVQGIDTDWMDEILVSAPITNTELSVSSGTDKTRFFMSGNYYKMDGVIKSTAYDRFSGRMNVDHKLLPNLTIGGGVAITYSRNDRVEGDETLNGPLPNAMSIPAIFPVYDSLGNYDESGPYANPVAIANETVNQAFTNRTNGNVYFEYKFLPGFTLNSKWGADIYNLREHEYDPITVRQGKKYNGLGIEGTSYVSSLITNNTVQYLTSINEKNNIDALIGFSAEKYASRYTYIEGIDFPNENLQYITSAGTIRAASASANNRGLVSFFGQFKYNYLYKYIFTLTARADGSSKFGENNKFGYFPAASLAWRMSEESFMQNLEKINELKLRISVGMTGNDGIPDFASLGLYGGGYNYGGGSGTAPTQLPNPDLKWETTLQRGFGADLAMFNERVNLTADVYFNETSDLLLARPLPPSAGFNSIYANIGELQNKGLELALTTVNLKKEVKWTTIFNFAKNKNEVTALYNDQPIDDIGRGGNRVEVGEPIGIFYGYRCLGVDPTTGLLVYDDINKDGSITSDDRTKTGDPNPDFTYGMTNNLSYKNFELSIFLQGIYGNELFNGTLIYLESGTGEDNQTTNMLRRWKNPGDITDMPKEGDTYKSSRFIEDGSYLKIKNITFGYNFDRDLMKRMGLKSAKVYATVQNAYTFTAYTGMDPEVNYYGADNLVMGTDFFTYPQARAIIFGLNLGF